MTSRESIAAALQAVPSSPQQARRAFCAEYLEVDGDPWAGTYCKLLAGHDGPCSQHYTEPHRHEVIEP